MNLAEKALPDLYGLILKNCNVSSTAERIKV